MRLAPTEKFARVVGDHEGLEVAAGTPAFAAAAPSDKSNPVAKPSVCKTSWPMSGPMAFILEWNSMQPTPSPRSMSEAPALRFTSPLRFFITVTELHARGHFFVLVFALAARQIEVAASGTRAWRVLIPVPVFTAQYSLDIVRDWPAFGAHASDGVFDACRVPQLERAQFPVEAETHGAIDIGNAGGDLRNTIDRVQPQVAQGVPEKLPGFIRFLAIPEQGSKTFAEVIDAFRHLQGSKAGLAERTVLESLPVDCQSFFARGTALLAVEATVGLVAQPLALDHLAEKAGDHEVAALVLDAGLIGGDVSRDVEPDHVDGAESGGPGPADSSAGERVHLLDAQVHLLHQSHDVEHAENADAVGDEIRRVIGKDDALAKTHDRRTAPASASSASVAGVGMISSRRM